MTYYRNDKTPTYSTDPHGFLADPRLAGREQGQTEMIAFLASGGMSVVDPDGGGDLVALDSTTLATNTLVRLKDPGNGADALLVDDGTASPMVGPDGHVYFGVLENPLHSSKGWMLQFDAVPQPPVAEWPSPINQRMPAKPITKMAAP